MIRLEGSKGELSHFIERTSFGNTTKIPRIQHVILKTYTSKEDRKKNLKEILTKNYLKKNRGSNIIGYHD